MAGHCALSPWTGARARAMAGAGRKRRKVQAAQAAQANAAEGERGAGRKEARALGVAHRWQLVVADAHQKLARPRCDAALLPARVPADAARNPAFAGLHATSLAAAHAVTRPARCLTRFPAGLTRGMG